MRLIIKLDHTLNKCLLSISLSEKCICFLVDFFLIIQYTNRTLPTTSSRTDAEPTVTPIITADMSDVGLSVCVCVCVWGGGGGGG